MKKYVLLLALIPAIISFINYGLIGYSGFLGRITDLRFAIFYAIEIFIINIASFYILTYSLEILAPSFGLEKNLLKSSHLAAYSLSPIWVTAIFGLIPAISFLDILGLYALYLLFIGLPVLRESPSEKLMAYFIFSIILSIIGMAISYFIINRIFSLFSPNPFLSYNYYWHW